MYMHINVHSLTTTTQQACFEILAFDIVSICKYLVTRNISWTAVHLLSLIEYSAVCYSEVFVYLEYAVLLVF